LRAKFEEWEKSQDAKDQAKQMAVHDENGDTLETASNLKAKFEALQIRERMEQEQGAAGGGGGGGRRFRPKRFKVNCSFL